MAEVLKILEWLPSFKNTCMQVCKGKLPIIWDYCDPLCGFISLAGKRACTGLVEDATCNEVRKTYPTMGMEGCKKTARDICQMALKGDPLPDDTDATDGGTDSADAGTDAEDAVPSGRAKRSVKYTTPAEQRREASKLARILIDKTPRILKRIHDEGYACAADYFRQRGAGNCRNRGYGAGGGGYKYKGYGSGGYQYNGYGAGGNNYKYQGYGAGRDYYRGYGAGGNDCKFLGYGAGQDCYKYKGYGAGGDNKQYKAYGAGGDGYKYRGYGAAARNYQRCGASGNNFRYL